MTDVKVLNPVIMALRMENRLLAGSKPFITQPHSLAIGETHNKELRKKKAIEDQSIV